MSEKYGFVYIWFNKIKKMYYIGSHWGHEDDGYVCSSNWMRNTYNRHPEDFKRRILSRIYTNRIDTFLEEERYLKMIKSNELRIRYYNISNSVKDHWVQYPEKRLSIIEKMAASMRGKKASSETKQKMSSNHKSKQDDFVHHFKGKHLSEEHKAKTNQFLVRSYWKGKTHTEEYKLNMSQSTSGEKNHFFGKKHTEESKQKGSITLRNKYQNGEITPWNKGNKLPEEELKRRRKETLRKYREKLKNDQK